MADQTDLHEIGEIQSILQELATPPRSALDLPRRIDLCHRALALLPREQAPELWAASIARKYPASRAASLASEFLGSSDTGPAASGGSSRPSTTSTRRPAPVGLKAASTHSPDRNISHLIPFFGLHFLPEKLVQATDPLAYVYTSLKRGMFRKPPGYVSRADFAGQTLTDVERAQLGQIWRNKKNRQKASGD